MRVGAFELEQEIGAGGMGVIWRARHVEQGVPAAVKFDLAARDPERREAFAAEVRRIAELDHPNVVHLFDTGVVTDEEAAGGMPEQVGAGTPWLAMELARAGSVEDWQPQTWPEVLHVITGLLNGLAVSHAHGIVHRDIKAANLLLAGPRSSMVKLPEALLDARVVLSDFGIGHDVDRPGSMDDKSVGTPRFMTPEQIEADWRNQGPWTDLYQTGVLLWRLSTGSYPFDGTRPIQLYRAHLFSQPPPFKPCMDAPAGLEALLRHMLEKDISKRPQLAGDVLKSLDALGSVLESEATQPMVPDPDAPTQLAERTVGNTTAQIHRSGGVVLDQGLRGAGLGLWGLRPLPLVGRERAGRVLSRVLSQTLETRSPRALVLPGPTGVGKTRLAMDLCRSAHERGDALFLVARHGQSIDGDHGLRGMIRRQLRLGDLEREAAEARIDAQCGISDPGSQVLLKTWLLGAQDNEREPSIRERFAILANVLQGWSAQRPRIVVLDDVEFGAESIRFTRWVLGQPDLPVLFLLTVGERNIAERSTEDALLRSLLEEDAAETLAVDPLSDADHRNLVRKMLGLEGRLAVEVERRTSGNPAFAVQLVNSWVESGRLVLGPDGFTLDGELDDFPVDLLEVHAAQVRRLLNSLAPVERRALQLIAMLGEEVAVREWQQVCDLAGTPLRRGLVGLLVQRQIIRADSSLERVRFRHNGFRQALLAQIRGEGVAAQLAGHCVEVLEGKEEGERIARLLLAAGRLEDAVRPLERAIAEQLEEDSRSPHLLETLTGVLEKVAAPDDERWGLLWLNWAWLNRSQGNHEKADRLSAKAELLARRHDWKSVLGWALREAGSTAISRAEYDDAVDYLSEAEGLLEEAGFPASAADCRTKLGVVYENQGMFARAKATYETCLDAFEDDPVAWSLAASPWIQLAQIAQKEGQLAKALDLAEEARWRAQRVSQTNNLAHIAMLEGEVARALGDLELASERYDEAHDLFDAFRDPNSTVAMLNLGVVGVLREDFGETRARMEALLRRLSRSEDTPPIFVAYARSVLLPCCAALGDRERFGVHGEELFAFLKQSGAADPDILMLARKAAELAPFDDVLELAQAVVAQQESRLS